MAPARAATDDAFHSALASLARVRQDELARMHDAQARLSRLLRRGRAACLHGCGVPELHAWGEDVVVELASLGLPGPDGLVVEEPGGAPAAGSSSLPCALATLEDIDACAPGAARAPGAATAVVPGGETQQASPWTADSITVDLTSSVWQWEDQTGFRCYTAAESERIEKAWRSGESKVRLKAGKTSKTPLEIFFADMVQLNPTSGSERKVRRTGVESLFGWLERNLWRVWKGIHTGQLRWETSRQYNKRQTNLNQRQQERTSVIDLSMMVNKSQLFSRTQFSPAHATRRAQIGLWCGRLVQAYWWNILAWLVTALNVFWIYWIAENYESTLSLWRPTSVIFMDFSFLLFFLTELIIRLLSYRDATAALQSKLFLRDAWVVVSTFVEVLLFPIIFFVANEQLEPGSAWFALALLVRLSRLVRVERLFRIFPQAATIGGAIISGLESAAIIILMMIGFLFGFAVMLKTGVADQALKERYFSSMSRTLETLVVQGLFFDGVLNYLNACHADYVGYFGMLMFICVGQYTFLNFLIGVFSSVAADATNEQGDRRAIAHLENNLASILECYLEDVPDSPSGEGQVDRAQLDKDSFRLILQNLDVLDVLEACGTDTERLHGMKDVLFPQKTRHISFEELYEVLLRLRKGKPASVTDVVDLRELTRRRTQELKELFLQRPFPAGEGGGFVESEAKRS